MRFRLAGIILYGSFLLLSLLVAAPAHADMYKYQDETGAVSITNDLNSVPKKYRRGMTVVREESATPQKLLPPVQPKAEDLTRTQGTTPQIEQKSAEVSPTANRARFIKTGIVIIGMLLACISLLKLAASLGYPGVGKVLFLTVILLGGVYLYGIYVKELEAAYAGLKTNALNIKSNVETREQKTDRLLKDAPEGAREQQGN